MQLLVLLAATTVLLLGQAQTETTSGNSNNNATASTSEASTTRNPLCVDQQKSGHCRKMMREFDFCNYAGPVFSKAFCANQCGKCGQPHPGCFNSTWQEHEICTKPGVCTSEYDFYHPLIAEAYCPRTCGYCENPL